MIKRKVLIVDDSFEIISRMRRLLKPMQDLWDIEYLQSGDESA